MNLDEHYCRVLGIFNPYKTAPYRLHKTIPIFDSIAYKNNPEFQEYASKTSVFIPWLPKK